LYIPYAYQIAGLKRRKFMRRKKSLLSIVVVAALVVCFAGSAGFAADGFDNKPVADEMIGSGGVTWVPKINYQQLVVTVSRPDGTVFQKTVDSGSTPYVDLSDILGSSYLDGAYTYELRVIPVVEKRVRSDKDSGGSFLKSGVNSEANNFSQRALTQSGGFSVKGGAIVTPVGLEPSSPGTGPAVTFHNSQQGLDHTTDQVIADDLIVTGSLCVGFDCVNGENFGFDTIRLKENNLRIKFEDTSNSGSFPSNDWQITANDSSNGGANKFSIDDIDGGRTPFTIEASAPSHSLYVDDGGRLGLGTSTPVVDVHVKSGNTPTLRLEQDGSSGFTPQTWDVAGNESNFFIRDVTNGSKLPFRIIPDAPTNSLYITNNGSIGVGTNSPSYRLHLKTDSSTAAQIVAEKGSGATMEFSASASYGIAGTKSNHPLRLRVNDLNIMELSGNSTTPVITMADGLGSYSAGWNYTSSRKFKENIEGLSANEAMNALEHLNPVKYNYKVRKDETRVGFIAEDVPELVSRGGKKNLNPMDILGVLTKVIKEQQQTISELNERTADLEKKLQTNK
jgi:hypothetical protein